MASNNLKVKVDVARKVRKAPSPRKLATKPKGKVVRLVPRSKTSEPLTRKQRDELVLSHRTKARKLARSILRKWHSRLDIQEVDSIVDLSLCEAVKRYNPRFGASFITFLYYHMRGNLIRAVTAAASSNTIPVADSELELLCDSMDRNGNSARGNINAVEIANALNGHDFPLPDETLYRREVLDLSNDAYRRLDPLEREVIYRIFLLEQQLIDVANSLGYSRCHISRVKRKALETLYEDLAPTLEMSAAQKPGFNDAAEGRTVPPHGGYCA